MTGWWSMDAPAVTGYLPHYRANLIDTLPVEKLTDIIFFSIAPKADGSLTQKRPAEVLRKLTARAHAKSASPHLRGWLGIIGGLRADDGQRQGADLVCSTAHSICPKT